MVQNDKLNEMTSTNILQCKYIDENCRLYVVKEEEFRPSPYQNVVSEKKNHINHQQRKEEFNNK